MTTQSHYIHRSEEQVEWENIKYKCEKCDVVDRNRHVMLCQNPDCIRQFHDECVDRMVAGQETWKCDMCAEPEQDTDEKKPPKKRQRKNKKAEVPDVEVDESDERCLVCTYGGELIMCDFKHCTKVYHPVCLGGYALSASNDSWMCPQHTCAVTNALDVPSVRQPSRHTSATPSPVVAGPKTLWKCASCPVAVCNEIIWPKLFKRLKNHQDPKTAVLFSAKQKSFVCPNCCLRTPEGQLMVIFERIWAAIATNPQVSVKLCLWVGKISKNLPSTTSTASTS